LKVSSIEVITIRELALGWKSLQQRSRQRLLIR
jgi:hypothetical protein